MKKVMRCFVSIALVVSISAFVTVPATALQYKDGTKSNTFPIQMKKWTYVRTVPNTGSDSAFDTYYFKFKAKKTGWLDVYIENMSDEGWYGAGWIAICDKSKKRISPEFIFGEDDKDEYDNPVPTFGVKEGKTYYVKIDQPSNTFRIKIKSEEYEDPYGKTKKKAEPALRNSLTFGTFAAGEKNPPRWFKIKLKQNRKLNFKFNTFCVKTDGIKYKVINSRGKSVTASVKKNKRLARGTYYVKVYKKGKTTGSFDFKWK